MFYDLNNLEYKKLEHEINSLDIEIKEKEIEIAKVEDKKLSLEMFFMENNFSEERLDELANEFLNESEAIDKKIKELFNSDPERDSEGNVLIEHEDFYFYCIACFFYYALNIKDLNKELYSISNKKLGLQKELVSKIETDRKYKELLKDEWRRESLLF